MKVRIQPAAENDIRRQVQYYVEDAAVPAVAERFLESIESTVAFLKRLPRIGAPKFLPNPRLEGLRAWPVSGFEMIRIYYLVSAQEILIVRVLHDRRDVAGILSEE